MARPRRARGWAPAKLACRSASNTVRSADRRCAVACSWLTLRGDSMRPLAVVRAMTLRCAGSGRIDTTQHGKVERALLLQARAVQFSSTLHGDSTVMVKTITAAQEAALIGLALVS